MKFPQPLVFLRHGITEWNKQSRYQGSTDTKLSDAGRAMMQGQAALIEKLCTSSALDRNRLSLVSSPLLRARQSAAEIATHLSSNPYTIRTEDRLRELSMGRWEGLNSKQVKNQFYEERKGRKLDRWGFAPKDGGESMAERASSIMEAVRMLEPHTIIVTHAVVLRILLHELGQMAQTDAASATIPHEGLYLFANSQFHLFGDEGLSHL